MTLYKKTLIIFGATLITLVAVLYLSSRMILLKGYQKIEEKDTLQNVHRALDALSAGLISLDNKTGDWAIWDDAYNFVENANADFIKTNSTENTFTELRINLILFIHSSGRLVYKRAFDLQKQHDVPFPASLQKHFSPNSLLLHHPDINSKRTGIILLPEGPIFIGSRPILTSEGKGPIRGTLVFGRYLDSFEVQQLAKQTHLSLDLYGFDSPTIPSDVHAVRSFLSQKKAIVVQPLNADIIGGYALMNDIYGKPSLVLRITMDREIYKYGKDSISYFILSALAIGIVLSILTLILLEEQVLSRLTKLIKTVGIIGESGDLSMRISIKGNDELSHLSHGINRMLETIEKADKELRDSEEKFRTMSATANETIIMMDYNGMISFWNRTAEKTFGYSAQEILGGDLHKLLVPSQHHEAFRKSFEQFRETGKGQIIGRTHELTALRKDGTEFPIELSVAAVYLKGKWHAIGIIRDITKRKQVMEALRNSEEKYRLIVENAHEAIVISQEGKLKFVNPKAMQIMGYPKEELVSMEFLEFVHPEDRALIEERYIKRLRGEEVPSAYHFRMIDKQGNIRLVEINVVTTLWEGKTATLNFINDITERKKLEEELQAMTLRDDLTGLYNRRGFMTLADQQLRIANRVKREMLLIFTDLDGMKRINDNLGHNEGDRALIDTARILRKTFRESDILARFGGDEFAVLTLEASEASTNILIDRLNEQLNYHNRFAGRLYKLSLSTGIARYDPERSPTLYDLLAEADSIMYEQKRSKKEFSKENAGDEF